ncbi:TPA: hypothetical protein KZI03_000571 [Listeria monocytogenes]|nr:hypothetical protein [Listeria monocytogenes]HBI2193212.1 hypothetical protein [Listeria monocytogenes]
MSKYKVGDKVVYEVKEIIRDSVYLLSGWKESEPLSTYTEPLEAKIRRQAAEITRLLAENKELKADFEKSKIVNLNAGRLAGQDEAWKLAQKIFRGAHDNGYSPKELMQIFGCEISKPCLVENTYSEAVAKVAEWEKAKEKICVGDVVRFKNNNRVEFCVTEILDDSFLYGIDAEGSIFSGRNIKLVEKTGRHIDIDGFLKQIGR